MMQHLIKERHKKILLITTIKKARDMQILSRVWSDYIRVLDWILNLLMTYTHTTQSYMQLQHPL
jgi:hypothetical protein